MGDNNYGDFNKNFMRRAGGGDHEDERPPKPQFPNRFDSFLIGVIVGAIMMYGLFTFVSLMIQSAQ